MSSASGGGAVRKTRKDGGKRNCPREVAYSALMLAERQGIPVDRVMAQQLKLTPLTPQDLALANHLVFGVNRWRNALDWCLSKFSSRPLDDVERPVHTLLRLGAYQLLYLDKVPPWAAVNEVVEIGKRRTREGAVRFINGVLRNLARQAKGLKFPDFETDPLVHLTVTQSHPAWLVQRWEERLGLNETLDFCCHNNTIPKMHLRANSLVTDRNGLEEALLEEGKSFRRSEFCPSALILDEHHPPEKLPGFQEGWFAVQDEASQLVAHLLSVMPGMRVLDACAGSGTKTSQLVELMNNDGQVDAWDINSAQLKLLEENCRRLGVAGCVTPTVRDAREGGEEGSYDRILVDAPCSGLGVLRRRPDIKWGRGPDSLSQLGQLQREILAGVAPLLRPGGVMVYSTCSTEPEENEAVAAAFLGQFDKFKVESPGKDLPLPMAPLITEEGFLKTLPHLHGCDGFFAVRFRRKG